MRLPVPSWLFVVYPWRYLDGVPADFNAYDWSASYEWERDPLWGLWDHAQHPKRTLETGRGDCVDYVRVITAHLVQNTDRPVSLAVVWRPSFPVPGHLVVSDGARVFSSGEVLHADLDEYVEGTEYRLLLTRTVREGPSEGSDAGNGKSLHEKR